LDLDETGDPSAGDLATALQAAPDPRQADGAEVRVVMDRALIPKHDSAGAEGAAP
jgi:hypothetical protein